VFKGILVSKAFPKRGCMRAHIILCTAGLFLALGAAEASAAQVAPSGAIAQSGPNYSRDLHDLGALPPASDSDSPTPASASIVSSAEAVPELPTWAMILLCFAGLGLAGFKRGRKDRLSPGID
jgi:hypothetical protein